MHRVPIFTPTYGLRDVLNGKHRINLHMTSLIAAFFLAIYAQSVCPFIDSLNFSHLIITLIVIAVLQVILREFLFTIFSSPKSNYSLARHGYYISIATWFGAGLISLIVHYVLYNLMVEDPANQFPISSHIKLLCGYWGLGGGVLAQWEYVDLETACRTSYSRDEVQRERREQLTHRLLEGYAIFTVVPALTMLLVVTRYVNESDQVEIMGSEMIRELSFLGLFFVTTSLMVAGRFGLALKRDTEHIVQGIAQVAKGVFDIKLDISRADEFGEMAKGINGMAQGLIQRERIREAFGHFLSPEVAQDFLNKYGDGKKSMLGGERKELSILFSDLRDFTPLSESLEPEALTELLNEYFSEMVIAVRSHGGVVDKFMGDAIMAIFGLIPEADISHEQQAVAAGIDMLERLDDFNKARRLIDPNVTHIRSGIGIHSGEMVAGYVGSRDRLEFTVIGQNVNLAARIEGQTKHSASPLLFSESVAKKLNEETVEVLTTHLKGISERVKLYSLKSITSE